MDEKNERLERRVKRLERTCLVLAVAVLLLAVGGIAVYLKYSELCAIVGTAMNSLDVMSGVICTLSEAIDDIGRYVRDALALLPAA